MDDEAGFFSEPPELQHKTGRTHCERCGGEVKPNVFHACPDKLCLCGLPLGDGYTHARQPIDDEDRLP